MGCGQSSGIDASPVNGVKEEVGEEETFLQAASREEVRLEQAPSPLVQSKGQAGVEISAAVPEASPEAHELTAIFESCWEAPAQGGRGTDFAGTLAHERDEDGVADVRLLAVAGLVEVREKLARRCFSKDPAIARKALNYLRRLLENSPVGHSDVSCGLFALLDIFMEGAPVERWGNFSLDISTRIIQCVCLIIEAIRAEHLIGNLPALFKDDCERIWKYTEACQALNVRASKATAGLLDESADILQDLWLETLSECSKRIKTTESAASEGLQALAGTAGAAIKLYKGDVLAGLTELKSTFRHNTLVKRQWYDDLVILRKLAADSVNNEVMFRQLRWTLSSGNLLMQAASSKEKPRFLMHVVLCLERLIVEGCTSHIREESFQLLTSYATSASVFLQFTAAKALENLILVEHRPKVCATARVVLQIVVRALMSQSDDEVVRNYADRLSKAFASERLQRGQQATKGSKDTRDEFEGYSSVIAYLITNLNEGSSRFEGDETLMYMASKVTSRHASRVIEVLRDVVYHGPTSGQYFVKPNRDTGLTPVHEAARSGVRANLEWMLTTCKKPNEGEEPLFRIKTDTGLQPIHCAGSIDVLHLLLDHRASLDAKDKGGNTVLHTLAHAPVVNEVLRLTEADGSKGPHPNITVGSLNKRGFPPLFVGQPLNGGIERSSDVISMLLAFRADLHQIAGQKWNALHAAASYDNVEVCRELLEARIDAVAENTNGQTALHMTGCRTIHVLLQSDLRAKVTSPDKSGNTPMHLAKDVQIMRELFAMRADINAENNSGIMPLGLAPSKKGDPLPKVKFLLEARADLSARTALGDPVFLNAVYRQELQVTLSFLQDVEQRQTLLEMRGTDGNNAVTISLFGSVGLEMLHVLSKHGADLETFEELSGLSAMFMCAQRGKAANLRYLISHGIDPNLRNQFDGRTILHAGGLGPHDLSDMIALRADPCATSSYGEPVIAKYLQMGKPACLPECLDTLMAARASIDACEGANPLVVSWAKNLCRMYGYEDEGRRDTRVLERLLESRCSVNAPEANTKRTALSFAAQWRARICATGFSRLEALARHGADARLPDFWGRLPLHYAVKNTETRSPIDVVKRVMELWPGAASVKDMAGDTPADLARRVGCDDDVVQALRYSGDARDGRSLLKLREDEASDPWVLAKLGRAEEAQEALGGRDLVGMRCPFSGDSILHAAIRGGSVPLVQFILQKAPQLCMEKGGVCDRRFPQSPLMSLATMDVQPLQAEAIARRLVQARADPLEDVQIDLGKGWLGITAARWSPGVLKVVLESVSDPSSDHTTMSSSKRSWVWDSPKDEEVVGTLLRAGVSMEPRLETMGCTALHRAARQGNVGALQAMLKAASPELIGAVTSVNKETPLHAACALGRTAAAAALLKARADVNATDTQKRTPLHYLSGANASLSTVKLLLEARADAAAQDKSDNVPVFCIGYGLHDNPEALKIVEALVAARADLTHANEMQTPVVFAVVASAPVLQLCLKARVEVDVVDQGSGNDLALHAASSASPFAKKSLELLQRQGLDIFASRNALNSSNILHAAARGHYLTLEYLLTELRAKPEIFRRLIFEPDDEKQTLAHKLDAVRLRLFFDTCKAVPEISKDLQQLVNITNKSGHAPLDGIDNDEKLQLLLEMRADPRKAFAAFSGSSFCNLRVVDMLLTAKADINFVAKDLKVCATPVQRIIALGDLPTLEEWINRGGDIHVKDGNGESSISYCTLPYMVEYLASLGCDVNFQSVTTGETLLHKLCAKDNISMVRYLLVEQRAKGSLNAKHESLLHVAACTGSVETLRLLIDVGFDLDAKDREGQTPLHLACKAGHIFATRMLLQEGAGVNARDELGETPFLECIRQGNLDIFQLLLEHRASVNARMESGQTCLHLACGAGRCDVLKRLLNKDVEVNAQTSDTRESPLHVAIESANSMAVDLLLADERVVWSLQNKDDKTPLDVAARAGIDFIERIIVARGVKSDDLRQPLLEAVSQGNREVCEHLVTMHGVRFQDCMDASGDNALHILASTGSDNLAEWVLGVWGPSLSTALAQENNEGMTPRAVAALRDNEHVVRAFNVAMRTLGQRLEPPVTDIDAGEVSSSCCAVQLP